MSRLLDPKFKYVHSSKTDIRKTIKREQRRLQDAAEARRQQEQLTNVAALQQRRGAGK